MQTCNGKPKNNNNSNFLRALIMVILSFSSTSGNEQDLSENQSNNELEHFELFERERERV